MASRFEMVGTLEQIVPVREVSEQEARDAYVRTEDGARLRVRLSTPELIERARARLSTRVVVTGTLVAAGVHQGPRLVEVVLAQVTTLSSHASVREPFEAPACASAPASALIDTASLIAELERDEVDYDTLTASELGERVLAHIACSSRVAELCGDMPYDEVFGDLQVTLGDEPGFLRAVGDLLAHLQNSMRQDSAHGEDVDQAAQTTPARGTMKPPVTT